MKTISRLVQASDSYDLVNLYNEIQRNYEKAQSIINDYQFISLAQQSTLSTAQSRLYEAMKLIKEALQLQDVTI